MTSSSSSFTAQQICIAKSLYRRLLRTQAKTFCNHPEAIVAAKNETRRQFLNAKQNHKTQEQIQEGLKMGEDVITLLKMNVVQGKWDQNRRSWQLAFTPETELGSNESVKLGRAKQLADLQASKGKLPSSCSPATSSSPSSPNSMRSFSTRIQSRSMSTTRAISKPSPSQSTLPLPRPVPTMKNLTILSDGSSILLDTTNPRSTSRLARDERNHPLWNPGMEVSRGLQGGRTGRFRRRFGGNEESPSPSSSPPSSSSSSPATAAEQGNQDPGKASATNATATLNARKRLEEVKFEKDDLDWMTGGREAKAGTPLRKAAGKGGKKK